jgi:hypothetical protein
LVLDLVPESEQEIKGTRDPPGWRPVSNSPGLSATAWISPDTFGAQQGHKLGDRILYQPSASTFAMSASVVRWVSRRTLT